MPKCGAGVDRHLVRGKRQGKGFQIHGRDGSIHVPQEGKQQCIESYNANGGLATTKLRLQTSRALVLVVQETGITEAVEGDASVAAAASG